MNNLYGLNQWLSRHFYVDWEKLTEVEKLVYIDQDPVNPKNHLFGVTSIQYGQLNTNCVLTIEMIQEATRVAINR